MRILLSVFLVEFWNTVCSVLISFLNPEFSQPSFFYVINSQESIFRHNKDIFRAALCVSKHNINLLIIIIITISHAGVNSVMELQNI